MGMYRVLLGECLHGAALRRWRHHSRVCHLNYFAAANGRKILGSHASCVSWAIKGRRLVLFCSIRPPSPASLNNINLTHHHMYKPAQMKLALLSNLNFPLLLTASSTYLLLGFLTFMVHRDLRNSFNNLRSDMERQATNHIHRVQQAHDDLKGAVATFCMSVEEGLAKYERTSEGEGKRNSLCSSFIPAHSPHPSLNSPRQAHWRMRNPNPFWSHASQQRQEYRSRSTLPRPPHGGYGAPMQPGYSVPLPIGLPPMYAPPPPPQGQPPLLRHQDGQVPQQPIYSRPPQYQPTDQQQQQQPPVQPGPSAASHRTGAVPARPLRPVFILAEGSGTQYTKDRKPVLFHGASISFMSFRRIAER